METYKEFSKAVESFFEDYLIKERGVSPQTIRAYGQTMKLYLEYCSKMGVPPEKISLQKLVRTDVAHFLDWLESEKCCSVSSRNQRLAAMRAFAKYLIMYDPIHIDQWTQICTVRVKKHTQETVNYLSVEGMACILRQIQKDTPRGRRDLTMLSLLYNSGARVQELIDLTPANLQTDKPYTLIVEGKRRKKRPIPLDEPIAKLVINYIRENYLDRPGKERHPLFYNAWGGKLSTPGVAYLIKKYADMARAISPELIPQKVSPHVFRHSRSMHLLQAGVPLIYIRDLLGHVSVQTTEIYARTSTKQKNEAIASAYQDIGIEEPTLKSWEKNPELMDYLDRLCGKK